MGSKRLLEYDRQARIATYHHYDDLTDKTVIETVQDVEPYLDFNKTMQNEHSIAEQARKRDLVRVGSIPITVQYQWMKEYGIKNIFAPEFRKKIISLLNSPDWKYLKTITGKI